jgi:hypothetical protein
LDNILPIANIALIALGTGDIPHPRRSPAGGIPGCCCQAAAGCWLLAGGTQDAGPNPNPKPKPSQRVARRGSSGRKTEPEERPPISIYQPAPLSDYLNFVLAKAADLHRSGANVAQRPTTARTPSVCRCAVKHEAQSTKHEARSTHKCINKNKNRSAQTACSWVLVLGVGWVGVGGGFGRLAPATSCRRQRKTDRG